MLGFSEQKQSESIGKGDCGAFCVSSWSGKCHHCIFGTTFFPHLKVQVGGGLGFVIAVGETGDGETEDVIGLHYLTPLCSKLK